MGFGASWLPPMVPMFRGAHPRLFCSGSGTAADTLSSWVAGRAGYCWANPFWKSRWKWYGNYMKTIWNDMKLFETIWNDMKRYETVFNCLMIYKSEMPGIRDATRLDDVGWQCWSTKSGWWTGRCQYDPWVSREIAFQRLVDPQKPEAIFGKSDLQSETWWQNIMDYIMIIIWLKVILWLSHG